MDPSAATQALDDGPSPNPRSDEDTPGTSWQYFPFFSLPMEIQLLIYRNALTRSYPILLEICHGSETQETQLLPATLASVPDTPQSVAGGNSDVAHNPPTSTTEREETNLHSVNATSKLDAAPVQKVCI